MSTIIVSNKPTTVVVNRTEPDAVFVSTAPGSVVTPDRGTATPVVSDTRVVDVITAGPQGRPGPAGPPGPSGGNALAMPAAVALGGHRVVRGTGDGFVNYANSTVALHGDDVLGLTLHAATAGANVNVQTSGLVVEPSWNWVPNEPVFLLGNGTLSQTPPSWPDHAFTLTIGFATSPTSLMLRIDIPYFFEEDSA